MGVRGVGLAGVLVVAKERGVITEVGSLLDELARCGYRLSDELVNEVLALAGEA